MNIFVFLALAFFTLSPMAGLAQQIYESNPEITPELAEQIKHCESQKNISPPPKWRYMNNTCVDECFLSDDLNGGIQICGQAFTWGCDCGPEYCYDSKVKKCVFEAK